ncbi:hypothetical protein D3C78_1897540 [compost metagenome]
MLQLLNHLLDFFGGLLRLLCQVTHLVGHHGKAAALFAGARRLDGRVQRQQIGLEGNAVDEPDHLAYAPGVGHDA